MKRIMTTCLAMALGTAVNAEATLTEAGRIPADGRGFTEERPCAYVESAAYDIMAFRQAGQSISSQMEVTLTSTPETVRDMLRDAVIEAYKEPLVSGQEGRVRISQEFASAAWIICYEHFSAERPD